MSAALDASLLAGDGLLASASSFTGLVPKTLASTGYTHPLDMRTCPEARFQCRTLAATDTPVGTFTLEGTEEVQKMRTDMLRGAYGNADTAQWTTIPIPTGAVHGLNGTALALSSGALTTDGSAALNFIINLHDTPGALRLKYTRTSGGGTSTGFRCLGSSREH